MLCFCHLLSLPVLGFLCNHSLASSQKIGEGWLVVLISMLWDESKHSAPTISIFDVGIAIYIYILYMYTQSYTYIIIHTWLFIHIYIYYTHNLPVIILRASPETHCWARYSEAQMQAVARVGELGWWGSGPALGYGSVDASIGSNKYWISVW